jgi:hypothetical protein
LRFASLELPSWKPCRRLLLIDSLFSNAFVDLPPQIKMCRSETTAAQGFFYIRYIKVTDHRLGGLSTYHGGDTRI